MKNTFALSSIRLVQRLAMILTLGCFGYVIFFLFFKAKDNPIAINGPIIPSKNVNILSPPPEFDLKPYNSTGARDVFSLVSDISPTGVVENTPKGQLPDYLKVVGIVIAHPSQIIIEDNNAHKTYFINEGSPESGFKIISVGQNQIIINYQGQNISVPVEKS